MMIRLRHKRNIGAFKGILSVIGLILFTAQLSYKFYEFANLPPVGSYENTFAHCRTVSEPGAASKCDISGRVLLSLDKRYDLKHIYFLPTPLYNLAAPLVASCHEVYLLPRKAISRTPLPASLRAPPFLPL